MKKNFAVCLGLLAVILTTATFASINKDFIPVKTTSKEDVSLVREDQDIDVDVISDNDLPTDHIVYSAPSNNLHNEYLKNVPQFPYPIAAKIELPNPTYNIDNTGVQDCSTTINQVLNNLALSGGGSVYIKTGTYRLDHQLVIPNRVTLIGDFYGPNATNYGTVFLCYKAHSSSSPFYEDSQVHLCSNTGINGFTFYYPNQNINNVTQYGYTVSTCNAAAATISNLFFINSYNGIAVNTETSGSGELINIENIYGTCLKNGIIGYALSDVGYWTNINLSPSYYANAIQAYRCNYSSTLYQFTRNNLTALTLGDLDDYALQHINIDYAWRGIYFPSICGRLTQAFWGSLNDVNLSQCTQGVYCQGIYFKGAALFTHSSLGKIYNSSEYGIIKLAKTRYDLISGSGKTVIETGSENYEAAPEIDDSRTFLIPNNLYYLDNLNLDKTGQNDVSVALQNAINNITTGGLIVLPNGTYRLDNPITIPDYSMLTSFSNSYTRSAYGEGSNETVKFISYNQGDACVKLGYHSGINGIRIYNAKKDIDTAYYKLTHSAIDSFVAVKGIGNYSFAINTEVSYTFTGFDFSNAYFHYIKNCYGAAYRTFIKVGMWGKVIASVSDWAFLSRTNLAACANPNNCNINSLRNYVLFETDQTKFNFVVDMLRNFTTMIEVRNSVDELLLNCFAYGYKCLVNTAYSKVLAVNTSIDYLKDENYAYIIDHGIVTIVNTYRVFGKAFQRAYAEDVIVYGRFDFVLERERYFDSNVTIYDTYQPLPDCTLTTWNLSNCESNTNLSGASISSARKHSGNYSWKASHTTYPAIAYSFSPRNLSNIWNNGFLRFYLYCSNVNYKGHHCTVELTSSGQCDYEEISYDIKNQITQTGWNEIIIELSNITEYTLSSHFDRTHCNFFRFYTLEANCNYYLDDIDFLYY